MFVHYEESILSSIAALRSYYGLASSYEDEVRFKEILNNKKPKKVFLMLVDGMGANLVSRKLDKDAFVNKYMIYKTQTVFPPTTTAATTAILNGKAPCENAWLGWSMYFKEVDDEVIPFFGKGLYSGIDYGKDFVKKLLPVTEIVDELNKKGIKAYNLYPSWRRNGCDSFKEMCERLLSYSNSDEYDFIYAYWDKYDSLMHKVGPSALEADQCLLDINDNLEKLKDGLNEDTMLIVIADHGQVDIHRDYNLANSEYKEYFAHRPTVEPRAMAFYIKEDKREIFRTKFINEFEDDYVLLSQKEVLDTKLFGDKANHPRLIEFIGDYLAIAKSDLCLSYKEEGESFKFKGQHAGMCEDELLIPFIVYMK